MKRLLNIAIILAMTAATLVGCSQEEIWVPNELNAQENGSTIRVNLNVSIPDPIKVESRAGEYDAIESMRIFCFNENHQLISTSIPDFTPANVEEGKSYELTAIVTYTTRYVHLVANQNFDGSNYTLGSTTEDNIFANLKGTEGKMIYWARVEIPEGTLAKNWTPETVLMIRNQAKVTVPSNEHFTVEGFTVVNTFASGTVAPKHPSNGYPTNGSSFGVVGESNSWSATDYNHLYDFVGNIVKTAATDVDENAEEMYIYESANPVEGAPSIIIKGKNPGETVSKYYRVTFTNNQDGGQLTIRRNHHYTVKIKGRMLYGSTTFNEALEAPSANNASLYIDSEVTAVGNTDFSLTVDDTKFVRISASDQTLNFGFSIGKSGSYPLEESKISVEWTDAEQKVSSTTTLSPVKNNGLSTGNKWRYDLSIDLNELGEKEESLEGTVLIKYGHKLQRMVTVKVIPALQFTMKGYYSKDPADAYKDPLASFDFYVPEDYPGEFPFTVLISTGDFTPKKATIDQKNISMLFLGDSGYGSDNEFGYKYAYQVTRPGEHSISLASHHGIVQDDGTLSIESELFLPAEYTIPLSGKKSKVWNNQFSLMVEQNDYVFITAEDEELKLNFEVEKLGEQPVEADKVKVVWGTEVLTPTLSSEDTKLKGELTVSLNDEDPDPIRTLFIKYGDELQRKIMVISKPMTLSAEPVYYAADDAENKNSALASLNFTIPSYPNDLFPFNVKISSEHFKIFKKGGSELSKDSDNKYIYRVENPGTYSVDLVSNGTATENGIVTLEAIDFETVICTIPLNQGSEEGE